MFAQLFDAAKRAISRTPSYQGRSSQTGDEIPEVPTSDPAPTEDADTADIDIMVTTRRGTETPGMASTPASSSKKIGKRELEALDTPTQTKRQKKTTVELTRNLRSTPRKSAAATSTESPQEAVDESVSDSGDATPKPEEASPLAIRRRSSPKVVVEPSSPIKEDGAGFHTPEPASSEAAFVTPFTSKKALAGSPTPKATKTDTPSAAKKARGRPKKAQIEDIPDEIPSSTQESSVASPIVAAPTAHVRFGSEEPTVNAKGHTRYEAPAPAPALEEEQDDDDEDSDEAPEMVSTSAAASAAAAARADTSRALAAQQEKERKKREARESRIAAEQAAKREREALKAQKLAVRAAKAARLSSVAEQPEQLDANDDDDDDEDNTTQPTHRTLPSLLPTSLLDTLDAVRPPTPPPETPGLSAEHKRREKLNHHIKFLEQSSKTPKDKRVGKHHVAVLGKKGGVLPPKVSSGGRGVREGWLGGRKGGKGVGKGGRMKFGGGGFLRGDD